MTDRYLLLIILLNGLLWSKSSFEKFEGGKFVSSLGGTLNRFASENPYPLYKSFLQQTVVPNSNLFGTLVLYGEALVAISLVLGSIMLLYKKNTSKLIYFVFLAGLLGGMVMNAFFYLAAGHTSPSTASVNLLMFGVQLIGFLYLLGRLNKR